MCVCGHTSTLDPVVQCRAPERADRDRRMGKVGTGRQRCPLHAHPFIQSCNGAKCNAVSALTETDRMGLDRPRACRCHGAPWLLLHPPVVPCFHPNLQSAWLQVAESPGATLLCSPGRQVPLRFDFCER